jgi:L-alanine-DL-glutamate epimerase-like enolase superfamily enzyme
VRFDDLRRIAAAPVPLAADESLALPGAWPALATLCRVVVLKPTLLGGLAACLQLARDAAARGLAATVTHTFDGPIAVAAAAELAVALDSPLACGLDRHAALAVWPAVSIPQIGACRVASAARPGLGLPDIGTG